MIMKDFTTAVLLLLCINVFAESEIYEVAASLDTSSYPNTQVMEDLSYYDEGRFGDSKSWACILPRFTSKLFAYYDVLLAVESGEIILVDNYISIEDDDDESVNSINYSYGVTLIDIYDDTKEPKSSISISNQVTCIKIDSLETNYVICSIYSEIPASITQDDIEKYCSNNDNSYYLVDSAYVPEHTRSYYDFSIQKIGNFVSIELQPIDDVTYPTLDDYFATKNFSNISSSDYIISQLSNDIECVATDTYGQRIYLLCPALTWSVDTEIGTATYTPYFTPRNYDTDWVLDNSVECSFSSSATETTKSILLWSSNSISNAKVDNFTIISGKGNITIVNNQGVEIYDIAGRQVYKGDAETVVLSQGMYIIVGNNQTEKILVK